MASKLALAGAALLAAACLAGCGNTTAGNPVCPGCGTNAEPNFPTSRPSATPPPTVALPPPSLTVAPGTPTAPSPGTQTLPANDRGYVFVETKSGKTRCQLNSQSVGCESQFENSPEVDGAPANGVSVTSGGTVHWVLGNLGDIPAVTLDYRTYAAAGWTIAADASGTRFTNDATGHGMFVAVEGVQSF